jgi:hypothetical protein
MVFIAIEIQSTGESASCLVNNYEDRNKAESKYHDILRAAAVSKVPVHSAVLMTDTGSTLKTEKYEHEAEE